MPPLLLEPCDFLKLMQVECPRQLAMKLFDQSQQRYVPSAQTCPILVSSFELAFTQPAFAHRIYNEAVSKMEMRSADLGLKVDDDLSVLPPLMLASNESFLYAFRDVILVCFAEGPIVPIVAGRVVCDPKSDLLNQLIFIYEQACEGFMSFGNIKSYLESRARIDTCAAASSPPTPLPSAAQPEEEEPALDTKHDT